jgi:hypothetical protein
VQTYHRIDEILTYEMGPQRGVRHYGAQLGPNRIARNRATDVPQRLPGRSRLHYRHQDHDRIEQPVIQPRDSYSPNDRRQISRTRVRKKIVWPIDLCKVI